MKIRNKDLILTNENGEVRRISFESNTSNAHIWFDEYNDEIVIEGKIKVEDIDTNNNIVSLSHDKLSDLNVSNYIHLTIPEYQNFVKLTDGSLVTDLHWHETVNGHKITINTGALPSNSNAFDLHIIENNN